MLRNAIKILLLLLVVAFARYLFSAISGALTGKSGASTPASPATAATTQTHGDLKQDPVCGAYVPSGTRFTRHIKGATVHFCSAECRDRYHAA